MLCQLVSGVDLGREDNGPDVNDRPWLKLGRVDFKEKLDVPG